MNYNYSFMPFGWIFMILFWVIIIYAVVLFVKWLINENKAGGEREKSALEILKNRYAKGEINKKEFAEKKKYLQ